MDNRKKAVADISEIFRFEQWLRFYFVEERGDKLYLSIPAERLEEIKTAHPTLAELAAMADGAEVDYQKSCDMVCSYVGSRLDGAKYSSALVTQILDSKGFQVEMYLFGLWIKGHEDHLDEAFRNFAEWEELYTGWKATEQVSDYTRKLMESPSQAADRGSDSVH